MKFQRKTAIVEKIDNNIVLMDEEEKNIITLNETACLIWDSIENVISFDELVKKFKSSFQDDINNEELEKDVDTVLAVLFNGNLLNVYDDNNNRLGVEEIEKLQVSN